MAMSRNRPDSSQAGPSQRQLRVAELVRHAIAEILARGEIADPVISSHMITVPEVRMSPDMRLATIYVVALGGKDETAVLKALEAHHKFIRTEIAHRVNLRYAPDIRFRRDDRFEEAERIDRLLRSPEVARDLDASETTDESDEETRS
ncbi:ribosome-binding factor A [Blastochloris tepida]|jgi:ribosome-binding factor A|uniref:Ribosome-binding factor A n=2 Tax=Blastochloris tepida TaxID=2233851 RepID=A0A348G3Z5_9HYPH|nr:ribosome-binding factor A [Blastochloris tepida]